MDYEIKRYNSLSFHYYYRYLSLQMQKSYLNPTISTRQKLGALIKRFLKLMDDQKNTIFSIQCLLNQGSKIFKDLKKAMDILFYFEAMGIVMRVSTEHMVYVGFRGMIHKLLQFQNGKESDYIEEIVFAGKTISTKQYALAGYLFASIFYTLIYQKDATPKSSIEEAVESFLSQHKDLNLKNFVGQMLNILSIMGLVQKNEATQVIAYIGPDLKCYDQNGRKVSWKVYEVVKKEELTVGRGQAQGRQQTNKWEQNRREDQQNPVHISYFPQLAYACLRSSSWEKPITSTLFFIGRPQKKPYSLASTSKPYRVDLELPAKSVSRQHALIAYNFKTARWEIRCLSRKNMIRVDGERYAWGDKNIWIRDKSEIQIGPEKFIFLEAVNPQ